LTEKGKLGQTAPMQKYLLCGLTLCVLLGACAQRVYPPEPAGKIQPSRQF